MIRKMPIFGKNRSFLLKFTKTKIKNPDTTTETETFSPPLFFFLNKTSKPDRLYSPLVGKNIGAYPA